jgi:hypothetical protein
MASQHCCGTTVPNFNTLSNQQANDVITYNRVGVYVSLFVELILLILWGLCDVVPGFVLYDGIAGRPSSFTHGAWWRDLHLISLITGFSAVKLAPVYKSERGVNELSLFRADNLLRLYEAVLVIVGLSDVSHFVLLLVELNDNTSTLARVYTWLGIFFAIGLAALVMLSAIQVFRVWMYRQNLILANQAGKLQYTLSRAPDGRRVQ